MPNPSRSIRAVGCAGHPLLTACFWHREGAHISRPVIQSRLGKNGSARGRFGSGLGQGHVVGIFLSRKQKFPAAQAVTLGQIARTLLRKRVDIMWQRRALEPSACPRLSEATHLLPLISDNIVAAVAQHPLRTGLELLPIVEDELFGYELVPDQETHTYLIIGRNAHGVPALRMTSYSVGAPNALQLIAVNGRLLSRQERAARYRIQRRDNVFADWPAAAEAACIQLNSLFPTGSAARLYTAPGRRHRHVEEALCVAYSHLARTDPSIAFFGLPNEAQMGFALTDDTGNGGELIFQLPDTWKLRWNAAGDVVDESWPITEDGLALTMPGKHGQFDVSDRRMHRRRASDRSHAPRSWPGTERREKRGRRTMDQCTP